jgi:uncharacterized protein YecT (DUF1311 family)
MRTFFLFLLTMAALFFSGSLLALDCGNPQTQADMNICAANDLDRETKKISKTYNAVRAKLDSKQQQDLKQVQLAWIAFKDLACKFEASGVEGGSIHPVIVSSCLKDKTIQRNKELDSLLHCQEGDLSCPVQ